MSGSGASNLGYSNIVPFSNVNGQYVNVGSTNNPANFGSNEIPGLPGLAGAQSNIDAAAGKVPGICLFKGGSKGIKRKIKNITKHYKKMKAGSRKMKSLKLKLRRRMASRMASRGLARRLAGGRRTRRRTRNRRRTQRGGYSQYQNNQPFSLSYSVGGVLPASQLALANPPPIASVTNNAVDNYNHYTNTGFPSKGH
jgi:hypothetical protein